MEVKHDEEASSRLLERVNTIECEREGASSSSRGSVPRPTNEIRSAERASRPRPRRASISSNQSDHSSRSGQKKGNLSTQPIFDSGYSRWSGNDSNGKQDPWKTFYVSGMVRRALAISLKYVSNFQGLS